MDFDDKYRKNFKPSQTGEQAFTVRVALGTLIIKTKLGISDEETVNQIAENPYFQYFLGYPKFREGKPFASSLITHFRKRFSADILKEENERIVMAEKQEMKDDDNNPALKKASIANGAEFCGMSSTVPIALKRVCKIWQPGFTVPYNPHALFKNIQRGIPGGLSTDATLHIVRLSGSAVTSIFRFLLYCSFSVRSEVSILWE